MIGGGFQSLTHLQEHRKPPSVKVHVSDSNKEKAPPFLVSENILRCFVSPGGLLGFGKKLLYLVIWRKNHHPFQIQVTATQPPSERPKR